jgi:hypothetical protein
MANNAGDLFVNLCGEAMFNLVAPSLPSALFFAAFTDSVNRVGTGTEVADPASNSINYARVPLETPPAWTEVVDTVWLLISDTDFNQALGGDWGTIESFALVAVATGSMAGSVVAFGDVTASVVVDEGDTLRINQAQTTFTIL